MLDLAAIEGFDWDDGNSRRSLDKHDVNQAEAEQVFAGQPLIAQDVKHSQDEVGFQALGETIEGRKLHVTFTLHHDDKKVRIISARDMNRKERAAYEQAT